jgi:GMP synthase (glutamine-hydrolysing)
MRTKPFLLLSIRAEDDAADDEYSSVARFSGLEEAELRRVNLTHELLPAIDFDDWSGIILGGGPFNASDGPDEKSDTQVRVESELLPLIDRIVAEDFPFLGCCYGVGTLGTAVGAIVDRTYGEPVGAVTITLTDAGRNDPLFVDVPDVFDAFGGHKEAVSRLPSNAVALASSPACPVQAFRVGQNAYATQFHPELDVDGLCTRIDAYRNHGYFDPDAADSLKSAARLRDVTHPQDILRRFVDRYAMPAFNG